MKKVKKPGKIAQAILAEVSSKSREADSDEEDITRAKVVSEDEENIGADETWNLDFEEAPRSKLRTKNVQLLSDGDARYGGKKTSRKKLKTATGEIDDENEHDAAELGFMFEAADDDQEDDEEEDELESDEDEEDGEEEEEDKSFKFNGNCTNVDYGAFGEDSDEEDSDNHEDASGDEDQSDVEEQNENDSGGNQKILRQDLKSELSKGLAIKQQLSNWDGLFECRIQIQKILTKINQYPQPDAWSAFTSPGSSADELFDSYLKMVKKGQTSLANLLDSLLELRVHLINQNPELLAAVAKNKNKRSHSDDDDEADLEEMEEEESAELQVPAKKMKLRQYEDLLSSDYESFKSFRNATIEKWNDKTRLATSHLKSKSFSGFESSTLIQIEHILADKGRLVKRTQLKRSAYTILGQKSVAEDSNDEADKEYDGEIFDDDDFYHQLLRELIERKTEGVTDPLRLGQKWLQIQKMRNKIKKKVDTKASKGRKTRFDIHSKLVNFMAPVYIESVLSEDSKTELFKSLFGKSAK